MRRPFDSRRAHGLVGIGKMSERKTSKEQGYDIQETAATIQH